MKNIGLILVIVIGGLLFWVYRGNRDKSSVRNAEQTIQTTARDIGEKTQEKLKSWNLDPANIKEELDRTGKVVRQKTENFGKIVEDSTADARTTATIKAKLVSDPDLSALSISVNTTSGLVTLSGTVSSPDHISKAMLLAMDTDGVREVASTLQVK